MGLFNFFKKQKKEENINTNLNIEDESSNTEIPKTWEEVVDFNYNEPYKGNLITKINNVELPKDYIDFMLKHNGGEGDLVLTWFILFPLDKLEEYNKDYEIDKFLKNSIIIGSNGGGELYGLNSNGEYFNVPEIIEEEYLKILGKDFNTLPEKINDLWK